MGSRLFKPNVRIKYFEYETIEKPKFFGRGGGIRTDNPYTPSIVRYQFICTFN